MSRALGFSWLLAVGLMSTLGVLASRAAEPPTTQPLPVPTAPSVRIEANGAVLEAQALHVSVPQTTAPQVQIDAVIYEVDPGKLAKLAEKTKSPVAELLKASGFELPKDSKARWPVTAVRDEPLSLDLKNDPIGAAFKRIAEPTLITLANRSATFLSGGEFPVPVAKDKGEITVGFREFGSKLTVLPLIEADGRIAIDVQVEESTVNRDRSVEVNGIAVPGLLVRRMSLAAKLESGQYLLIANGTSESDLTQFVQLKVQILTPAERVKDTPASTTSPSSRVEATSFVSNEPAARTPRAEPPQKTNAGKPNEIIVQDRWPLADVQVGQSAAIVPVFVSKTHLDAEINPLAAAIIESNPFVIQRIEALPNNSGRRIGLTVSLPDTEKSRTILERVLKELPSATTVCVLPVSTLRITDLYGTRLLKNIADQLPADVQPQPVELTVGETFNVVSVAGLISDKLPQTTEIGPLALQLLDDDCGGFWRVTAQRTGIGRIIEIPTDGDSVGRARLTDYFVKADTRELEIHLRQQFPAAKIKVTPIGSSSLLLQGTAASEADLKAIIEIAEQFTPKVISRLTVAVNEPTALKTTTPGIEGIPLLDKVPHQSRLFKNTTATKVQPSGKTVLLLATPRVIVQDDEEQKLSSTP